ncbi:MAG: ABC transporter substrate-binding protein [Anaerovorax sp.]
MRKEMAGKSKKGKWIILVLLIFSFAVCATACENPEEQRGKQNLRMITDCVGREVEVPAEVEKIAALDSFAGEAMVMLGAGDQLVGAPNGVKRDKLLQEIYPDLVNLTVPMSGGTVNAETLLTIDPDVIFLKGDLYLNKGELAKLDKLDIPYLVVRYTTMKEQMFAFHMIGTVLGGEKEKKAMEINEYYQETIDLTGERAKQIPENEKLRVYHSIQEAVRTDGEDSLGADWTKNMGLTNVSVGENLTAEGSNYYCGMEQIFVWNPDVILCNDAMTKEYLLSTPKWAGLGAVAQKKVYNIPVGATRWGQQGSVETFFAMLWTGVTLYPEYYMDIDLKTEVMAFYKDYLGLALDEQTYGMILSGQGIRTNGQNAGK